MLVDISISSKSPVKDSRQVIITNRVYAVMDLCTGKSLREDPLGV